MIRINRRHIFPNVLAKVHSKSLTPVRGLIALYLIVLGVTGYILLTGNFSLLLLQVAAIDSIIYALVGLAALKHLVRYGGQIPFKPFGGRVIFPLVAIVFIAFGALIFATSSLYLLLASIALFAMLHFLTDLRLKRKGS